VIERKRIRFQRSTVVLSRRVGSDVLVTTPMSGEVHELMGGAAAVWAELRTPRTLIELVERLSFMHGEDPSDIAAQVDGCLDSLVRLGAVEEVQDSDG
jgi:hypothetical protein